MLVSSPRTWGCFHVSVLQRRRLFVFPTHVGVFHHPGDQRAEQVGLPHARGGVSLIAGHLQAEHQSSPRTWGCFSVRPRSGLVCRVFPTHVGVFPHIPVDLYWHRRLPHARGGVSFLIASLSGLTVSSPRTWGCFHGWHYPALKPWVFPTHVGVFPFLHGVCDAAYCLPHARGGVSEIFCTDFKRSKSSPRTWGCFWLFVLL